MRSFSSTVLATLGLVIGSYSYAQAQTAVGSETVWTLQQSVDHAVKNNLQIRQAGLAVEQTAVDVKQARMQQLPNITGSASHGFNNGFFLDPARNELQNTQSWTGGANINGSVNLFSGLQNTNTIKRNKLDLQASQLDQQKAQNDVVLNVVLAFMQVLFNQELLKTNEERVKLTQSQLERTQKLFKAGSVPESNVLDLNAQVASDELNIITAQNNIELAELRLIQLLNLQNATPANFAIAIPAIPDPDQSVINFSPQEVYQTAEQVMPDIKRANIRLESAMRSVEIARGGYLPSLSLVGSISTRYSSRSSLIDLSSVRMESQTIGFVGGNTNQPVTAFFPAYNQADYPYIDQFKDNVGQYIGLNLSVPILNGFRVRNNVQLSRIGVQNAQLNSDIAKNDLQQTIMQAYTDAVGAQRRFVSAKRQLEAFEQAYKNAEIRLNNGLINNVDFNVARNNLVKAQSDIIQAKYDYTFKLKILEFYQGKTITL
ncbi:TolC family protein [Nibribacter koreensis]|uniref:TolC family protein n=1 Tax=Nibribacter koreensis TaxID=1084519 RepID=A0ABP8F9K0_9BACT